MIVVTYFIYLVISVGLTVWVGRALHQRGAIFLVDAFRGNTQLAASINHLLVVGFYLMNIGFVSLALKSDLAVGDWRSVIEMLSAKLGWVLLTLGAMHFLNLLVFSQIRRRGIAAGTMEQPPVAHHAGILKVSPVPHYAGAVSDYLR